MKPSGVRGSISRSPGTAAVVCALLLVTSGASGATAIYSLKADWSDTQNPNGVWSYNQNTTSITVHQTFWWGQAGWGYMSLGDGGILRGSSPAGMTDPYGNIVPPANDWQPGDVMLHALSVPYGGDSTFVNVTWTSPAAGPVDIDGQVWDGQINSDRDIGWELRVGGELYAQRGSIYGLYRTNVEAQLASNVLAGQALTSVSVTQGEVVELRVIAKTYYGQFAGVELNISSQPGFVPLPVLSLTPMSLLSFSNLTVGNVYQLQRAVAWYWVNEPVSFTASNAVATQFVPGQAASGEYRLALSPAPAQAFATPQVVNGFVVGANVTSGGSGYATAPPVTIVGGGGSNATALAQVSGGAVTNITITSAGIGYSGTPTIRIDPPPAQATVAAVTPVMRLDSANVNAGLTYQVQYQPQLGATWQDWPGGLFTPTGMTDSQYLLITNATGFFRVAVLP